MRPNIYLIKDNMKKAPEMEGGRYFRTGAYEKEKYYRKHSAFYV